MKKTRTFCHLSGTNLKFHFCHWQQGTLRQEQPWIHVSGHTSFKEKCWLSFVSKDVWKSKAWIKKQKGKIKVAEMRSAFKATTIGMGVDRCMEPGPSDGTRHNRGGGGGLGQGSCHRVRERGGSGIDCWTMAASKPGGSRCQDNVHQIKLYLYSTFPATATPSANKHVHEHTPAHKRFRIIITSTLRSHPYWGVTQSITSGSAAKEKPTDPGSLVASWHSRTSPEDSLIMGLWNGSSWEGAARY